MKKELDLYIDESGDFGFNGDASKYYILSFIFHDTKTDLTSKVNVINSKLKDYMMNNDYFHAGPLIRGENNFRFYSITERKRIFQSFFMFFCSLNISTQSFVFCKEKYNNDTLKMMAAITKELYNFLISLSNTKEEIRINVYYDNGQVEITKIMNSVFSLMPYEYALYLKTSNSSSKLFQIADLVSTLKLYEVKMINHELSKSELAFIDSRNFKKVYLKSIERKKLNI